MSMRITDSYTFDTFRQTEDNRFAYAASIAVSKDPVGSVYNSLIIYGKTWIGKTHLLFAIKHEIEKNNPKKKVKLISVMDFIDDLCSGINDENEGRENGNLQYDVLLIDDFSYVRGKAATQEALGKLAMSFAKEGKQIVISHTGDINDVSYFVKYVRKNIPTALFCDIR